MGRQKIRDCHDGYGELSFVYAYFTRPRFALPSDLWIQLGAKRKQLLDRSWAGVFQDYLLLELPVGEQTLHFSKDFGRPSKDLHVVLGALVLQQLHDLTDAQTVEAIAFNPALAVCP